MMTINIAAACAQIRREFENKQNWKVVTDLSRCDIGQLALALVSERQGSIIRLNAFTSVFSLLGSLQIAVPPLPTEALDDIDGLCDILFPLLDPHLVNFNPTVKLNHTDEELEELVRHGLTDPSQVGMVLIDGCAQVARWVSTFASYEPLSDLLSPEALQRIQAAATPPQGRQIKWREFT